MQSKPKYLDKNHPSSIQWQIINGSKRKRNVDNLFSFIENTALATVSHLHRTKNVYLDFFPGLSDSTLKLFSLIVEHYSGLKLNLEMMWIFFLIRTLSGEQFRIITIQT